MAFAVHCYHDLSRAVSAATEAIRLSVPGAKPTPMLDIGCDHET